MPTLADMLKEYIEEYKPDSVESAERLLEDYGYAEEFDAVNTARVIFHNLTIPSPGDQPTQIVPIAADLNLVINPIGNKPTISLEALGESLPTQVDKTTLEKLACAAVTALLYTNWDELEDEEEDR